MALGGRNGGLMGTSRERNGQQKGKANGHVSPFCCFYFWAASLRAASTIAQAALRSSFEIEINQLRRLTAQAEQDSVLFKARRQCQRIFARNAG